VTNWVIESDLTSVAKVSLLLGWENDFGARRIGLSSLDLLSFSSALTLVTISSACSPYSTKCDISLLPFERVGKFADYDGMSQPV